MVCPSLIVEEQVNRRWGHETRHMVVLRGILVHQKRFPYDHAQVLHDIALRLYPYVSILDEDNSVHDLSRSVCVCVRVCVKCVS